MTEEQVHTTKYDIDPEKVEIIRTETAIPISEVRWAGFTFATTFEQAKEDLKNTIRDKIIEEIRINPMVTFKTIRGLAFDLEKADSLASATNPPRHI